MYRERQRGRRREAFVLFLFCPLLFPEKRHPTTMWFQHFLTVGNERRWTISNEYCYKFLGLELRGFPGGGLPRRACGIGARSGGCASLCAFGETDDFSGGFCHMEMLGHVYLDVLHDKSTAFSQGN